MDNIDLKPFSRQVLPQLFGIFLSAIALVVSVVALFYQQQQSLEFQLQQQLPQAKATIEAMQSKNALQRELHAALMVREGSKIDDTHVLLLKRLAELLTASQYQQSTLAKFDVTIPERLAANSDTNELVRQASTNQVNIVLASLEVLSSSDLSAPLATELQLFRYLMRDIAYQLNSLNLQTSINDFEVLSDNVSQAFILFEGLQARPGYQGISLQMTELNNLLKVEQRLIAKWRGYLRLYKQYQQELLTNLLHAKYEAPNSAVQPEINTFGIGQELNKLGINLSPSDIINLLWGLIGLSGLALVLLLYRVNGAIVGHRKQLESTLEQAVLGEPLVTDEFQSEDIAHVYQKVTTISQPAHSEEDYQQLKQYTSSRIEQTARLAETCDWFVTGAKLTDDSVDSISTALEQTIDHVWRRNFSFSTIKKILNSARITRQTGQAEILELSLNSGKSIKLIIEYSESQWRGILASNDTSIALSNEIVALQKQQDVIKKQAYKNTSKSYDKLAQMLVQSMLQSQNIALVSGVSIQSSYRPLARMFEWIRQQQILSHLSYSSETRRLQDVDLVDEIHSAVFNALTEANLQQNKLILNCDDNLASDAKLDVRLFGRLLSGFCRLALKEQYKSRLLLSAMAIDQNSGQQVIKFSASVKTVKALVELPRFAQMLNDEALNETHTGIESYFFGLYCLLHGTNLSAELTDEGYKISFELPIAISLKSGVKPIEYATNNNHALVLCRDKSKQKVLKSYLEKSMASVEGLAKVELFAEQFDLKHLNRKKLDIVVFAESNKEKLSDIVTHLESLPQTKRPKLVVLQDSYNSSLARNGLYSLASAPICRESLLGECERLLRSDDTSNLLVSDEKLSAFRYEPSQVEVLLAVKSPQEHQALWLLLQWLGFNVKIVCHGKAMQKHWQSGRYLVLFNEFDRSPFIQLTTGKSIARGVFNFSSEEVIELDEEEAEIGKHWHFGSMPSVKNIKTIIQLLSPWLKHKSSHTKQSAITTTTSQSQLSKDGEKSLHAKLFDSSLIDTLPPAFDLEKYASNQGSPELAAYMLDDYIASISDDLHLVEVTLGKQSFKTLGSALKQLHLTANILSAKGMMQITQQLEQAFCNEAYDKMIRLVEQAKVELSAIKAYAEAI